MEQVVQLLPGKAKYVSYLIENILLGRIKFLVRKSRIYLNFQKHLDQVDAPVALLAELNQHVIQREVIAGIWRTVSVVIGVGVVTNAVAVSIDSFRRI